MNEWTRERTSDFLTVFLMSFGLYHMVLGTFGGIVTIFAMNEATDKDIFYLLTVGFLVYTMFGFLAYQYAKIIRLNNKLQRILDQYEGME